ncbi:NAD(P)H-binding protein [Carnobacterium funditum]|uniref:NmrA family NAD(P)-binding protein n=1 Tax=Carnobacterium funditum TaxID=2752 RepID=UPI00068B9C4A|nr:NAD(P)H-binding protein [Carnobacterium funditum]
MVTGASGNIGQYVVEELLTFKKDIKAAVHNIEKAKTLFKDKENVELVKFDFLDKKTFEKALEGVRAIFLVRPPNLAEPQKDRLPFLKAAKGKGIEKIVFVSLLGVGKNPIVPHRKIEHIIKNLSIPYVFLRLIFLCKT